MNISARFARFIANIRPTREQIEDADRQVTFLREHLVERITDDARFHLEKIFRAGSAAKHTNLAPRGKGTFDIDLGIYYRAQGQTEEQLNKLLPYTLARVREIYPSGQTAPAFREGKNAVNVTFQTSGLKVDVVPIIRDGSLPCHNSGWIPRQDGRRLTSITAHTHFIHCRTARSKLIPGPVKFNHLVRLMKWWNRRLPDNLKQCSYFCELITAAALEKEGVAETWQDSLARIFRFLDLHAFARPISFGNYDAKSVSRLEGSVVVLDAVNPENNVAHKWDETIKQGFLEQVGVTYKAIKQAQEAEQRGDEEGALNAWCKVLGDDFRRLS
jgi:hypothetical protein